MITNQKMLLLILLIIQIFTVYTNGVPTKRGVVFAGPKSLRDGWTFHGQLSEKSDTVLVVPQIKVVAMANVSQSNSICGINVHHSDGNHLQKYQNFPFLIVMETNGVAQVRLKPPYLERLKQLKDIKQFIFQIEAFDCDRPPHYSERKFVVIAINSINTINQPRFTHSSYHFTINSSQFYHKPTVIGQVAAIESPQLTNNKPTNKMGGICHYELIASNSNKFILPFDIDQKAGILRTRIVKSNKSNLKQQYYKFLVRATDCNIPPRRTSTLVTVDVANDSTPCTPHWTGLPNTTVHNIRVNKIIPILHQHSQPAVHTPSLHLCSNMCGNPTFTLTARLMIGNDSVANLTPATSSRCLHDEASVRSQARTCGASSGTFLLKSSSTERRYNKMENYDNYFDGYRADNIDQSNFLGKGLDTNQGFTITYWMKHGIMREGGPKEHVLCNSDDHQLNRHHYSIFLHNCKLVLLKRTESNLVDDTSKKNNYKPSEYRFGPLLQVCDNKWHHYGFTVHRGQVMLQIDGETVGHNTMEILIDKPLHRLVGGQGTMLSVGACYNSKNRSYSQYFHGYLSKLTILPTRPQPANVIRCMATCGESLQLPHVIENMDSQSVITILSDIITIRTPNLFSLLRVVSTLSYLDTIVDTDNMAVINRRIVLNTFIKCNVGQDISIKRYIISIKSTNAKHDSPKQSLSVQMTLPTNTYFVHFNRPTRILKGLKMMAIASNSKQQMLESCILRPIHHALTGQESIEFDPIMVASKHLSAVNNSNGLVIEGVHSIADYRDILAFGITYRVTSALPAYMNHVRTLGLVCSVDSLHITDQYFIHIHIDQTSNTQTYYLIDDSSQGGTVLSHSRNEHVARGRHSIGGLLSGDRDTVSLSGGRNSHYTGWIVTISVFTLIILVGGAVVVAIKVRRQRNQNLDASNKVEVRLLDDGSSNSFKLGRLNIYENPGQDLPPCVDDDDDYEDDDDDDNNSNDDTIAMKSLSYYSSSTSLTLPSVSV